MTQALPPLPRRQLAHLDPATLAGFERNARTHSPDQLRQIRASIDAFGATNPILIDEDRQIIAGHGRRDAALLKPALAEFPCIVLEGLSPEQKRALVIADNKIALNAGWDLALLQAEIADLRGAGVDLASLGFSASEANAILSAEAAGLADPDAAPPAEALTVAELGDLWHLGPHRLACGSCTDPLVVAAALDGSLPHLMVTDPPYGVEYDPAWRESRGSIKQCGKVAHDDLADWREAWALFPGQVAYIWHAAWHAAAVADSLTACGYEIRNQIIWAKPNLIIGRGHYHWQHEPCWYAVRGSARWAGDRKQSTLWQIAARGQDAATTHGTQKPVECMRRPMQNNSLPGDHVYEPFSGSGTTLIAAEASGRVCHAVELMPAYVDMAIRRWEAFTGREATLGENGATFAATAARRPAPPSPLAAPAPSPPAAKAKAKAKRPAAA